MFFFQLKKMGVILEILTRHRRWLLALTVVGVFGIIFGGTSLSVFGPLIAVDRQTIACLSDGTCLPLRLGRLQIDQLDNENITHLLDCTADGSCIGGNVSVQSLTTGTFTCTGTDLECYGLRIKRINNIDPDVNLNFGIGSGQNIQVDPGVNSVTVRTTDAVSVMQFSVSGAAMLGLNTSCMKPLLPSCYDISGQQCSTPLGNNCLPSIATFDTVIANNLILLNGSVAVAPADLNTTTLSVETLVAKDVILTESMTCSNSSIVAQSCLNLGGYSCPFGEPLADSCFPANMTFYDAAITHEISLNLVQCLGPPMPSACFPTLTGDVTGNIPTTYLSAIQGTPLVTGNVSAYDVLALVGTQWVNAPSSPLNVPDAYMRRDAFGNASANVVTTQSVQSIDAGQCLGVGRAQPKTDLAAITATTYLFDRDSYYGSNDTVYVYDMNTGTRVLPSLGNIISFNDYTFGLDGHLWAVNAARNQLHVFSTFPSSMSSTLVCSITGTTYARLLGFASDGRAIVIDAFPYPLTSLYLIDLNTCVKTLITINVPAFSLYTAYRDTVYILSADTTTPTTNLWAIDNVLALSGTQRFIGSTRIRSQVNTLYGPPDQFFPVCYKGAMRLFVTGGSGPVFTALIDPYAQANVMPAVGLNTDTLNYAGWFYLAPSNPFECSPPLPQPAAACLDGSVDANGHDIRNISVAYVTEIRSNEFRKGLGNGQANVTIPDRLVLLEDITFGNDTTLSRPQKGRIQTGGDFVARGHYIVEPYALPTAVAGAAAGTSPTLTVASNSNDCKMQISLTTGTATPSNDILFTVTYAKPFQYNITKGVVFSPANANAVGANVYVDGATESLTSFIFRVTSPSLAISTLFMWNFQACA